MLCLIYEKLKKMVFLYLYTMKSTKKYFKKREEKFSIEFIYFWFFFSFSISFSLFSFLQIYWESNIPPKFTKNNLFPSNLIYIFLHFSLIFHFSSSFLFFILFFLLLFFDSVFHSLVHMVGIQGNFS